MNLEKSSLDKVLSRGEEDLEFLLRNDACTEQFILRKDVAGVVILSTPSIETIGNSVSTFAKGGRTWSRRGSCDGSRRHDEE